MARVLALDYGLKRVGIAATDPLQIIATPLETVETPKIVKWLKAYTEAEPVERIVIGLPYNLDSTPTDATAEVQRFITVLERLFPLIPITPVDEQFSSKDAEEAITAMGMRKEQRREKGLTDRVAAALLLQRWLDEKGP